MTGLDFTDRAFDLPQALALLRQDSDRERLDLFRQLIFRKRCSGPTFF